MEKKQMKEFMAVGFLLDDEFLSPQANEGVVIVKSFVIMMLTSISVIDVL